MLIAMAGLKGSGKDTAAAVLVREYGFKKIAFADALREMSLVIDPYVAIKDGLGVKLSTLVNESGWDKVKREVPEVRRILQVIGTEAGRKFLHEDIWISILNKDYPDIAWDDARYVITDCRFRNEADFVHEKGGDICWVDRPGIVSDGHASESTDVKNVADYLLDNSSSIEELEKDIRFMLFMKGITPIESGTTGQAS
jgi:deoxynucleotide monophosphate kinase-like protein